MGLPINLLYFGLESVFEPGGVAAHFHEDLISHFGLLALIPVFPVVSFFIYRALVSYRLRDYSALLEQEVGERTRELEAHNEELTLATDRISSLISTARNERSFSVRYENPGLVKCWEVKNCTYTECPSYNSENLRCWQVAGTHCGGEVQGVFANKLGKCEKCDVYRLGRSDWLTALGEDFNNMMAMLGQKADEQRQLEKQLVHSTKLAAVGELAANVAHEINNPLTGVLTHASLLLADLPGSDSRARSLKIIENEALRARDIVRNLLDFARREGSRKKKVFIRDVVEDSLSLLRKQAELAHVEIARDYHEGVPDVYVDTNQMKQVFINILNNAIHAMPEGGRLTVTVRAVKPEGVRPWVEAAFADTGVGIPPDRIGKVFDPFFTSKEAGEGTGLGLSVSQRIIEEQHNGSIAVESRVGAGSTFTIKLPTANIATGYKHVA